MKIYSLTQKWQLKVEAKFARLVPPLIETSNYIVCLVLLNWEQGFGGIAKVTFFQPFVIVTTQLTPSSWKYPTNIL